MITGIFTNKVKLKQTTVGQWMVFGITIGSFAVSVALAYFKAYAACGIVVGIGASFGFLMGVVGNLSGKKDK